LKGRIYERRSDLSPDGDLLACYVANNRPPLYSWVAISRPPYLTALALWPGQGMWGGGLFGDDWRTLRLNYLSLSQPLTPTDQERPTSLKVSLITPLVDEEALVSLRLERDGWIIRTEGKRIRMKRGSPFQTRFDPPAIRDKAIGAGGFKLRVALHGTGETNGSPYVETSQILDHQDHLVLDLGRIDWSDIDHNGDVLYAAHGCLYRLRNQEIGSEPGRAAPSMIADLNGLDFESVVAPEWARHWP
jgi:hypothetical protein